MSYKPLTGMHIQVVLYSNPFAINNSAETVSNFPTQTLTNSGGQTQVIRHKHIYIYWILAFAGRVRTKEDKSL